MHVTENGAKNYIKSEMLPGLVAELTGLGKKPQKLKEVLFHHLFTFCHPKMVECWQ